MTGRDHIFPLSHLLAGPHEKVTQVGTERRFARLVSSWTIFIIPQGNANSGATRILFKAAFSQSAQLMALVLSAHR